MLPSGDPITFEVGDGTVLTIARWIVQRSKLLRAVLSHVDGAHVQQGICCQKMHIVVWMMYVTIVRILGEDAMRSVPCKELKIALKVCRKCPALSSRFIILTCV
jgi:hypothetical protein